MTPNIQTSPTQSLLLTVIIPTRARPDRLGACIAALARDPSARGVQVLVGIDGDDIEARATETLHAAVAAAGTGMDVAVRSVPRTQGGRGQARVRNTLLPEARGSTLLFLNDDMLPRPGLVGSHVAAQARCAADGRPALVVGDAPWVVHHPDRLLDRLIRSTSMIFFYDQMHAARSTGAAAAEHDWGFRHAWLLNLSAPTQLVRDAGGFSQFPCTYGYEDDELAFRLQQRHGTRVIFEPAAVADHDHRYSVRAYLEREYMLGYAGWGFAQQAPGCAQAMFGRDVASAGEIAWSRAAIDREHAGAARALAAFAHTERLPAHVVDGPDADSMLDLAYQAHIPIKRWAWRRGLVDAADRVPPDPCRGIPTPAETRR